jgi:hypothetical protein
MTEMRASRGDNGIADDGPRALALHLCHEEAVICAACGCRLNATAPDRWRHFPGAAHRDARGCHVLCIDLPHALAPWDADD